jgi:cobalt-zinc-cadmium efflux system membrane fusion protein
VSGKTRIILILVVILSAGFAACHSGDSVAKAAVVDQSQVKVEEAPDTNVMEVENPADFKLVAVSDQQVQDQLHVAGSVTPDVSRTVPVVSMGSGRVIEIKARLGDQVKKGQPLLTISSSDLASAFSDYQKFTADEVLAKRQLDRSQFLFSHGAAPQKDLEAAEDADKKAKVDTATAAERIRLLGGDINHPTSVIELSAPVSGVIVEQNVTGSAGVKSLDNSPNLFTIADLSAVWIIGDVYENDLGKVRLGQQAEVRFNAFPDRVFKGRVSNIGQILDPNTRAAHVRLEIDNPGGVLRPNMFGTVTFFAPGKAMPAVPAAAVLRLHDKSWVFVPDGPKRFKRQEVQPGQVLPGGMQEILSGVKTGDQVVGNALALSTTVESSK